MKLARAVFVQAELERRLKAFIDQHRDTFGGKPICKDLCIAPSPGAQRMRSFARKSAGSGAGNALLSLAALWNVWRRGCVCKVLCAASEVAQQFLMLPVASAGPGKSAVHG